MTFEGEGRQPRGAELQEVRLHLCAEDRSEGVPGTQGPAPRHERTEVGHGTGRLQTGQRKALGVVFGCHPARAAQLLSAGSKCLSAVRCKVMATQSPCVLPAEHSPTQTQRTSLTAGKPLPFVYLCRATCLSPFLLPPPAACVRLLGSQGSPASRSGLAHCSCRRTEPQDGPRSARCLETPTVPWDLQGQDSVISEEANKKKCELQQPVLCSFLRYYQIRVTLKVPSRIAHRLSASVVGQTGEQEGGAGVLATGGTPALTAVRQGSAQCGAHGDARRVPAGSRVSEFRNGDPLLGWPLHVRCCKGRLARGNAVPCPRGSGTKLASRVFAQVKQGRKKVGTAPSRTG